MNGIQQAKLMDETATQSFSFIVKTYYNSKNLKRSRKW